MVDGGGRVDGSEVLLSPLDKVVGKHHEGRGLRAAWAILFLESLQILR